MSISLAWRQKGLSVYLKSNQLDLFAAEQTISDTKFHVPAATHWKQFAA